MKSETNKGGIHTSEIRNQQKIMKQWKTMNYGASVDKWFVWFDGRNQILN